MFDVFLDLSSFMSMIAKFAETVSLVEVAQDIFLVSSLPSHTVSDKYRSVLFIVFS